MFTSFLELIERPCSIQAVREFTKDLEIRIFAALGKQNIFTIVVSYGKYSDI